MNGVGRGSGARFGRAFAGFAFVAALVIGAAAVASAFEPLPETPPVPADNPMTEAKVELGKRLFFEPRLSSTGTVSCNSCHNVMEGGDDDRPNSVGVGGQTGGRGAPTVWNAAFLSVQFWDGRAASLEDQAKGPITNPIEMGMADHDAAVARLKALPGYVTDFAEVFGGDDPVNIDNVAKAIAAYERTLITPGGPFDRYLGGETGAISAEAAAGAKLFESTGCVSCHSGPALAGPTLPQGSGFFQKFPVYADDNPYVAKYDLMSDKGRSEVTGNAADANAFRVPTLRNIAITAPYFHNGTVKTLGEAVRVMAKSQLAKELGDDDVRKIVEFLKTLTGAFPEQDMPRLPAADGTTLID